MARKPYPLDDNGHFVVENGSILTKLGAAGIYIETDSWVKTFRHDRSSSPYLYATAKGGGKSVQVADGKLWRVSEDNNTEGLMHVWTYDPNTLAQQSYYTFQYSTSIPYIVVGPNGNFYIVDDHKYVKKLDSDGNELFTFDTSEGSMGSGPPATFAIKDGTVILTWEDVNLDGHVSCYDTSGNKEWHMKPEYGNYYHRVIIAGNRMFGAYDSPRIICLDLSDGSKIWKDYAAGDAVRDWSVGPDGYIYMVEDDYDRNLRKMDQDGSTVWNYALSDLSEGVVAGLNGDYVFLEQSDDIEIHDAGGSGYIDYYSNIGDVYSNNYFTGFERYGKISHNNKFVWVGSDYDAEEPKFWRIASNPPSSPAQATEQLRNLWGEVTNMTIDSNGDIFSGGNDDYVCGDDLFGTGRFAQYDLTADNEGTMFCLEPYDSYLYVGTQGGYVIKLNKSDLSKVWAYAPPDSSKIYSLTVDGSGTVYAGDNQGHVIKIDSTGSSQWSKKPFSSYDNFYALETDSIGEIYVGGQGPNFAKMDPTGSKIWEDSNFDTTVEDAAVDSSDNIYVGAGDSGGELTVLDTSGNHLDRQIYLGADNITKVKIDSDDIPYIKAGRLYKLNQSLGSEWDFSQTYLGGFDIYKFG